MGVVIVAMLCELLEALEQLWKEWKSFMATIFFGISEKFHAEVRNKRNG
jgi:hypothetical protein